MLKKLTLNDKDKYLKYGILTQPFLDQKVLLNALENEKISKPNASDLQLLLRFVRHNLPFTQNKNLIMDTQFNRTAEEIYNDKFCTGCTDKATIFVTLARQLGIPATLLHTAEKSWLNRLKNNQDIAMHYGHTFCECFVDNKWILVDPTYNEVLQNYDCNNIHLPYQVGNSVDFIAYYRGLDLGKKQSVQEHNQEMETLCLKL